MICLIILRYYSLFKKYVGFNGCQSYEHGFHKIRQMWWFKLHSLEGESYISTHNFQYYLRHGSKSITLTSIKWIGRIYNILINCLFDLYTFVIPQEIYEMLWNTQVHHREIRYLFCLYKSIKSLREIWNALEHKYSIDKLGMNKLLVFK